MVGVSVGTELVDGMVLKVGSMVGVVDTDGAALGDVLGRDVVGLGVLGTGFGAGASSQPQFRRENICKATQLLGGTKPSLDLFSSKPHS